MDRSNNYEREIDLKDLMFTAMRRWRLILAAAAIMALILGGYKGVLACFWEYDRESEHNYEKELELYNQSIAVYEREIENLTEDIENQQEYLEKSVFMNMSPYEVWEAKADFFVETDYEIMPGMTFQNKDFTATVLQSYESALNNAEFMEQIAKENGMEVRYLKELISITIGRSDEGYNNLLHIQVRHEEENKARELIERLAEGILQCKDGICSKIKEHTITEVGMSLAAVVDLQLADRQRNEKTQLENLLNSLAEKQSNLEEQEKAEPTKVEPMNVSMVRGGIKYGMLGGVLGAFGAVFFICAGFVMSDKVSSAKELKYRFQIRVLGSFPLDAAGNKPHPFDVWLNRLEGRNYEKDISREYDLAAVNILNYVEGSGPVFVTGGALEERIRDVAEKLAGKLCGMEVISGGNFLLDPESLKRLPDCGSVILVEQCGISTYTNTEMEIEKISDLHKRLAGCIVFE